MSGRFLLEAYPKAVTRSGFNQCFESPNNLQPYLLVSKLSIILDKTSNALGIDD